MTSSGIAGAGGVGAGVELGVDGEPGAGGGGADRADDDLVTGQRAAAPVAADPGEQAVLDLVPLRGARRNLTPRYLEPAGVGEAVQFLGPSPHPVAVRATRVGTEQQPGRRRVAVPALTVPPAAQGRDREHRRCPHPSPPTPTRRRRPGRSCRRARPCGRPSRGSRGRAPVPAAPPGATPFPPPRTRRALPSSSCPR